jgi:catechol 2,3-dioxygenase-like lactoylglutathione lyase family enzyme
MAKTVEFYRDVLGMPLTKTIDLPGGMGQHFFFDIGNGDSLAFFWFPERAGAAARARQSAGAAHEGSIVTAHGSMNHIAFDVPPEKFDEYCTRLKAKGVKVTMVMNHDDSPSQVSRELHPGVFVRSVYFFDPTASAWNSPPGLAR